MKNKFICMFCIIMLFSTLFLCACSGKEERKKTVKGEVVEVYGNGMMVDLKDNSGPYEAPVLNDELAKQLKVGDWVSITYSGGVLECYPPRLDRVSKVELLEK